MKIYRDTILIGSLRIFASAEAMSSFIFLQSIYLHVSLGQKSVTTLLLTFFYRQNTDLEIDPSFFRVYPQDFYVEAERNSKLAREEI